SLFLHCLQIGVIIFLAAALETQSVANTEATVATEATDSTKATEAGASPGPTTVTIAPVGEFSSSTAQPSSSDQNASDSSSLENGGYPFGKPGKHHPFLRHVKAHDGFHSLRSEKHWARWNDAFTTPKP
ncbi:hypothetical protein KR038_011095, partial [Drosophila bunnanda]